MDFKKHLVTWLLIGCLALFPLRPILAAKTNDFISKDISTSMEPAAPAISPDGEFYGYVDIPLPAISTNTVPNGIYHKHNIIHGRFSGTIFV